MLNRENVFIVFRFSRRLISLLAEIGRIGQNRIEKISPVAQSVEQLAVKVAAFRREAE